MIKLEELLSASVADSFTLSSVMTVVISGLVLGLAISLVYMKTYRDGEYSGNFAVTMIMLPAIIAMIILLVGSNIARAFSLAGAFSLIRFRSAPGDPKDIAYVFFTLGVGLACGMGYILYAAIFAAILCLIMVLLGITDYGAHKGSSMKLKITVPENLNYRGVFDETLNKYTAKYVLSQTKTTEFGNLFELTYIVNMKEESDQKNFIDELRCLNGNLSIALTQREFR